MQLQSIQSIFVCVQCCVYIIFVVLAIVFGEQSNRLLPIKLTAYDAVETVRLNSCYCDAAITCYSWPMPNGDVAITIGTVITARCTSLGSSWFALVDSSITCPQHDGRTPRVVALAKVLACVRRPDTSGQYYCHY